MSIFVPPESTAIATIAARLGFESLEAIEGDEGRIRAIVRADTVLALASLDSRLSALERRKSESLESMTLAQLEALADRLGNAARTIRDAQALLGGGAPAGAKVPDAAPAPLDPAAAHRLRQMQAPAQSPGSQLTAAEQAEKRRMMEQFKPVDDPNLPEEIRAMERGT